MATDETPVPTRADGTGRDDLAPEQAFAVLARALFREGYDNHIAGHITIRQPDGTMLVNPEGFAWNELTASDVMRIDEEGNALAGRWSVPPPVLLHVELHRLRPNLGVVIHHHPRFATIYAAARRIPPAFDQFAALADAREIVLFEDFVGQVSIREAAAANAAGVGEASYALLANHGVIVMADSVDQALTRGICLEWRCRQAWHVEAVGGGTPMPPGGEAMLLDDFNGRLRGRYPMMWEYALRREVRSDPSVLD